MSIKKKINYWRNYLLYSRYKNKYPGLGSNSAGQHDNLDLALNWILNTHKASKDKGVPAVYHLSSAIYLQSYRETTGYIICTLLDLHQKSADPLLIKTCHRNGRLGIVCSRPIRWFWRNSSRW